jgi:PhzF family phenazine biosynthesis protein
MEILRYSAFTDTPDGGNPAGVVLDATGASDAEMQKVAAEVGYSETAFLFPDSTVRYFSPAAEVPFCGHATIALAAAYAERHGAGSLGLQTKAGLVTVTMSVEGGVKATLTSVEPGQKPLEDLPEVLAALGWDASDLDPALPPVVAYAGVWHPIIAVTSRQRLADLNYDFPRLAALMNRREWTTVCLVWRESRDVFHTRNPFPPGGVIEDPATGAASAALGGYLRALGEVSVPATITIYQGYDMGRPSLIGVSIPESGGIQVTGAAVSLASAS